MEAGMVRFLGRDIHFPRGYGPRRDSSCWFTPGVICSGGETTCSIIPSSKMTFAVLQRHPWFSSGVDLYSTLSIFLGAMAASVFALALIYCVR